VIVRVLLWSLGDAKASLHEVRDRLDQLEPLESPSVWLANDATERFGALLYVDDDDDPELPEPVSAVGALIGRDPDVWVLFARLP
jgi:hypothetical protein